MKRYFPNGFPHYMTMRLQQDIVLRCMMRRTNTPTEPMTKAIIQRYGFRLRKQHNKISSFKSPLSFWGGLLKLNVLEMEKSGL